MFLRFDAVGAFFDDNCMFVAACVNDPTPVNGDWDVLESPPCDDSYFSCLDPPVLVLLSTAVIFRP